MGHVVTKSGNKMDQAKSLKKVPVLFAPKGHLRYNINKRAEWNRQKAYTGSATRKEQPVIRYLKTIIKASETAMKKGMNGDTGISAL